MLNRLRQLQGYSRMRKKQQRKEILIIFEASNFDAVTGMQ
jgi:hypothetical protein